MEFSKLRAMASELGINEVEAYSVKNNGMDVSFFDGDIIGNTTKMTNVMCIRGVYNNHIATVYTERLDEEGISLALNTIKQNASLITKEDPYIMYEGSKEYPTVEEKEADFDKASAQDKINLCKRLDTLLKSKSDLVYKTEISYAESESTKEIKNSNGLSCQKASKSAYIVCECICLKDGDMKVAYDYVFINKMADLDLDKFADKLIDDAVSQFGADSIPSGSYDVVLDRDALRGLMGAYSSAFCADSVLKNMSFLKDKLETKVFGDNVTLIDDPLNAMSVDQDTFDDEGVATKTKVVVENGVLKTYLHNLTTAKMMNVESTANGFKASIASPVGVSPENLYLKPGDKSLDELFEAVGNGVYINSLDGLHAGVNTISGDFSLKASGYNIEGGKKTSPVTLIIITSSFQEILNKISYIGNDLEFRDGLGAPSIALKGISISGK